MAQLSFPANPSNGQQYTDPNANVWEFDSVKWNIATTDNSKQFSGVKVQLGSALSLSTISEVVVFDVEQYDTSTYFLPAEPTRIVIPRTGYYRVNLQVITGPNGSGNSYAVNLFKNELALFGDDMAPNQSGIYDDTILLSVGDVLQLFAEESTGVGTLETGTTLEVQLVGFTFGGAIAPGYEFSGVKVDLFDNVSTTSTPTAITWTSNDIVYNVNANEAGSLYWNNSNPTRFTLATAGYYRLKALFLTGTDGAVDSYIINVRKNGTTSVESGSLGALDFLELDNTYYFSNGDYLEILVSNIGNVGTIDASDTSFAITRLGV